MSSRSRVFVYEVYARHMPVAKLRGLQVRTELGQEFWGRVEQYNRANYLENKMDVQIAQPQSQKIVDANSVRTTELLPVPQQEPQSEHTQLPIQENKKTETTTETQNLKIEENTAAQDANKKIQSKKTKTESLEQLSGEQNIQAQKIITENPEPQQAPEPIVIEKPAPPETSQWSRYETTQDASGRQVEVYRAKPPKFLGNPPQLRQRPGPPEYLKPPETKPEQETKTDPQPDSSKTEQQVSESVLLRKPDMLANLARMFPEKNDPVILAAQNEAAAQGKTLELDPEINSDAKQANIKDTTLTESTRRFLKPIVGTDPSNVRVWRGPDTERILNAIGAEAATVGQDIVVANHFNETEPKAKALLAHEMLHVAKRSNPRFVPAKVNAQANEESQALQLEAIAKLAAQHAKPKEQNWNGLPAPWEAMPQAPGEALPQLASSETVSLVGPPGNALRIAAELTQQSDSVRKAEQGRIVPTVKTKSKTNNAQSEPNIDAIAQEVYVLVKRRMANERRRGKGS